MQKLKSGFIFIPFESEVLPPDFPKEYKAYFLGGFGVYAKLDSESPNGYDYVSTSEYDNA